MTHFNRFFSSFMLFCHIISPLFASTLPHILYSLYQLCYRAFRRSQYRIAVRGYSPQKALEAVIHLWMASVSSVYFGSSRATPCSSVPGVTWVRVGGWGRHQCICTTVILRHFVHVLNFHLICFCVDNDKRWKDMVERNPLYVLAFSGPVYLGVDSFLLLG